MPLREKRVLDVRWDVERDELSFSYDDVVCEALAYEGVLSKRYVLKVLSSICDPLGVLSAITVNSKLMFQELCSEKLWGHSKSTFAQIY